MQVVAIIISFIVVGSSYAEEENGVKYQPMNSGVEIIFTEDGSGWLKMQAIGVADLNFGDTTDIRQATQKAVLRAKADLSKYLSGEKITSEETSEEITKLCQTATPDGQNINKESTRKIVDTTVQKIVNQTKAILKGVLLLETDVNREQKQVRVTVGVSRKSIAVANSLKKAMESNSSTVQQPPNTNTEDENVTRRSKNYNNY